MNKILIVNNSIIPFEIEGVINNGNIINFTSNGSYIIEYIDSNNISLDINVLDNVSINLFEYHNGKNISININFNVGSYGNLIISKFNYNESTNSVNNVYLNGNSASVKYNFSSISKGHEKYTINIYHKSENTSSDIFNRTISLDGSSNYFDINSFVDNGIINTYLNQQTKIITLGEADNRINPNMFVGEESTSAIHSSTIGTIDENYLFYLMSRGIDYNTSIKLIIKGMILSNINPTTEYREKILGILNTIGGE